ncbi:hypothetical protein [Pyxidicoccus xibeiensis]|uniref:hypothetical protein n=1 Tax=Pyxidicoccus xibeiensis TaxID=2906759 RepID=UPI0020A79452|nr:hypothetical protein [Pyxidicoccus xibeiensis]MCP3137399.1 hypothetical protein [Pyxidicoccus xibeiensis]
MYIVRDKTTKKVIHVNPAPLSQALEGQDIYFQFDPKTMEVGRGDLPDVPSHFNIDAQGNIVLWTLQEKVAAGVVQLPPNQKMVGDTIVEKTLPEKVASGVITLKPEEKLVGDKIVEKSLAEKVAEKLVTLKPTQILEGESIREMTPGEQVAAGLITLDKTMKVVGGEITPKSRAELAREGLIPLAPDEGVQGDEIVKLTPRQLLDAGRITLAQYKEAMVQLHAQANLEARRKVLPDHELLYAAIGALPAERVTEYRTTVQGFVRAFDQSKLTILKATSASVVDAVPVSYGPDGGLETSVAATRATVREPPDESPKPTTTAPALTAPRKTPAAEPRTTAAKEPTKPKKK